MDLKRLTEFVQLTHKFQAVLRVIDIPGGTRAENDLEHTCQLAFVSWYLNEKDHLGLDPYRVLGLALVHDLVEIHAGDTYAYGDKARLQDKAAREARAAAQLAKDWSDFPPIHDLITEYEAGETPAAKLVYSLDKLLPMLNNYLDGGRSWRAKGVEFAEVKAFKTGKADRSPAVAPYFKALLHKLERSRQLFPPAGSGSKPSQAPAAPADRDRHYLERARDLAATSPDPIGCGVVIIQDDRVLAETTNSQRTDNQAVFHAEIKAVMTANQFTRSRTLPGATAYCSCEPCAMCLTALAGAKVGRIVYDLGMADVFPNDPQSKFDAQAFIQGLNFVPKLEQLRLKSK